MKSKKTKSYLFGKISTMKKEFNDKTKWYKNKIFKISILLIFAILLSFFSLVGIRGIEFNNLKNAQSLSVNQKNDLDLFLKNNYSERHKIIQKLPYTISSQEIDVLAESAILIDMANGNILYEKNADRIIPPASMTKLFAMYVVEEEIRSGALSYDDIIYLPPECWACNMPPHSSLMFLGKGQIVTVEELLLGLSICSGNDAAYALAYAICGNMDDFVVKMNQVAVSLGLKNTHFVESSGYSELNTTTTREMASFARIYIKNHPQSLKKFHSVKSFTYPKEKNLAPGDILQAQDFSQGIPEKITMSITQKNTNPLLDSLFGCDGLKTGYIDESGYNLSLTAQRDFRRFLSVTMKGPGNNSKEGQQGRIHDGTELMEYAFKNFSDLYVAENIKPIFVKVFGSKEKSLNLIPAFDVEYETIPFILGENLQENIDNVKIEIDSPDYLFGNITMGTKYGEIRFLLGDYILDTIPLVADRNIEYSNMIIKLADSIYCK